MSIEGGCYCGNVRYTIEGDPIFKGQCCCRACTYISGGNPNVVMGVPEPHFSYTKGRPKQYRKTSLENPVTRDFCPDCGTHLVTWAPAAAGIAIVKVGTLDDPSLYDKPDHVIWLDQAQPYHHIPEGCATFPGFPPR